MKLLIIEIVGYTKWVSYTNQTWSIPATHEDQVICNTWKGVLQKFSERGPWEKTSLFPSNR